jgi:DNA repair protein RecO (recombination protein O)
MEKALALVLRTTDWSETSRIATLWTREFGKVRALAKGGRRLKSAFENALDLLTVCSIVFIRKSAGTLDLLTEALVVQRFPRLRQQLDALYGGYYVAELLGDLTQEYDPHPALFDEAVATLEELAPARPPTVPTAVRLMRFEMVLLRELGYALALEICSLCGGPLGEGSLGFSPMSGGLVCRGCRPRAVQMRAVSAAGCTMLRALGGSEASWRRSWEGSVRAEVRQVLGHYVTYLMGRRPRLLPYLGSGRT